MKVDLLKQRLALIGFIIFATIVGKYLQDWTFSVMIYLVAIPLLFVKESVLWNYFSKREYL